MITLREQSRRKRERLRQYREQRLAELLEVYRAQAARQAEQDRYAWKGEFRPRAEILELYRLRRRWDRRFLVDLTVLVVLCAAALIASPRIVSFFLPGGSAVESSESGVRSGSPPPGGAPAIDPGR